MRILRYTAALALLAGTAPLSAQQTDSLPPPGPSRHFVGGSVLVAQPQGEFRENVDVGAGLSAHYIQRLDAAGVFALRVDGGLLIYGNEHKRVPFSNTVGGRVMVDVNTTNSILTLGIGPQIMAPTGRLRPYLNATAGLAYFVTQSSVEGTSDNRTIANTTNYDDASFAYGAGAGVYVPLRRGAVPISLDAGVRYSRNGRARYLREGSIRDNPDSSITITPLESQTDLLTFHLGVSVGLPGPRARTSQPDPTP